jgi:hypothetical protein
MTLSSFKLKNRGKPSNVKCQDTIIRQICNRKGIKISESKEKSGTWELWGYPKENPQKWYVLPSAKKSVIDVSSSLASQCFENQINELELRLEKKEEENKILRDKIVVLKAKNTHKKLVSSKSLSEYFENPELVKE